jgi:hypothetical protein
VNGLNGLNFHKEYGYENSVGQDNLDVISNDYYLDKK